MILRNLERRKAMKKLGLMFLITGMALMSGTSAVTAGKWAVVLVDLQGDFTIWKKGSLGVAGSDEAYVKQVEAAVRELKRKGIDIYATQDWHPKNHLSFYTNHPGKKPFEVIKLHGQDQVLWPPHCVQCTENAKILIDESVFTLVAQKGMLMDWDSYSGFYVGGGTKTVLESALKKEGVDKLLMFGIATDYCVKSTAVDGAKLGFEVTVVEDLCRGVDPKTIKKAIEEMPAAGVRVVEKLDDVRIR
jgi:nicotinamidase/pyrazinamidase